MISDSSPELISLDCPRCGAHLQTGGEVLVCQYCGAKLIFRHAANSQRTGISGQAGSVVNGLTLQKYSYFDPQSNLEAFSILVPLGWQVSGGVTWVTERPAAPVQISLLLANPHGAEAFELFPNLYFTWTENPLIMMTKPPGSLYFGFEVRQPAPARNVLHQYVLPRYRRIPGLVVADEGPAIELLQAIAQTQPAQVPGGNYSRDSARVRLQYGLGGQAVAEEMSFITEYTRLGAAGLFGGGGSTFWNVAYHTAFRAPVAQLESFADLYRAIFASVKLNPTWMALVQQVIQGLSSNTIRHIQQIGAISRQISQNAEEMREQNLQGWQQRSASSDRVAEQFSQTIRGVDAYYDPNTGQNVELPSGYTQAWSTPLGEYMLTDDPNFNPNVGSTQTWIPLEPPKQ
jgi:DNA-directed RNA polymerase subunit RPC12/RpoP